MMLNSLEETKTAYPACMAAKWIKIPFLIDFEEMQGLLSALQENAACFFFPAGDIVRKEQRMVSPALFADYYREYITLLKSGKNLDRNYFQKKFSLMLSNNFEALYSLSLPGDKYLLKSRLPLLQIQANFVRFSPEDKVFRCQVYGESSFSWGIQISFPQIYQDPETAEIRKASEFPNSLLFKNFQKWMRANSRATPFVVQGIKTNEPIRIGKACLSWINNHPELRSLNISVDVSSL